MKLDDLLTLVRQGAVIHRLAMVPLKEQNLNGRYCFHDIQRFQTWFINGKKGDEIVDAVDGTRTNVTRLINLFRVNQGRMFDLVIGNQHYFGAIEITTGDE